MSPTAPTAPDAVIEPYDHDRHRDLIIAGSCVDDSRPFARRESDGAR